MKKYKKLTVTLTQDYFVEMIDDERSYINGWSIEKVIDDWFNRYPLSTYHATRDGHKVGNSEKILKIDISDV